MSVATCNGFGSPETPGGEIIRAEPDTELHCSPVLRPDVVMTGDSERRRSGAQRAPPPPLGLSKAHIPARQRKGSVTCYRGASLIQVRLRGDVAAGIIFRFLPEMLRVEN